MHTTHHTASWQTANLSRTYVSKQYNRPSLPKMPKFLKINFLYQIMIQIFSIIDQEILIIAIKIMKVSGIDCDLWHQTWSTLRRKPSNRKLINNLSVKIKAYQIHNLDCYVLF